MNKLQFSKVRDHIIAYHAIQIRGETTFTEVMHTKKANRWSDKRDIVVAAAQRFNE